MKRLVLIISFCVVAVFPMLLYTGCSGPDAKGTSREALTTDRYERGEYSLELSYPSEDVEYGSTVDVSLRIEYPDDEHYILLPPVVNSDERYSNTVIKVVDEGRPVLDGSGRAVSKIVFSLEAWLPGEIVFPPLTVSFKQDISTDEAVISVVSAFDGEEDAHELAPLYTPQGHTGPSAALMIVIVSAVVAAIVVLIIILKHGKKKKNMPKPVKTRRELIEEFRHRYIETDAAIDLREAFNMLAPLISVKNTSRYREQLDAARFSKDSINYNEGLSLLREIFDLESSEVTDDI